MVHLDAVRVSNAQIPSLTPEGASGLVAIFAGGTSGIGESTLKQFAKHATKPKVYILGRNEDAGKRIAAEAKGVCSEGNFTFIKADLSLMKNVDEVCAQLKSQEPKINLLFLTSGILSFHKEDTVEGLEKVAAVSLYSRIRLMQNLLPHLQKASPGLARIVNVFAGAYGGACFENDLAGRTLSALKHRSATATMTTMAMEHLVAQTPEVSFLHVYPGFVRTPGHDQPGIVFALARAIAYVFGRWICVPLEESGERNLFHATSGRYPPKSHKPLEDDPEFPRTSPAGVPLPKGVMVAETSEGSSGGIYLINWDGETMSGGSLLAQYRTNGMREKIWQHIEEEFERIGKL